MAGFPAEKYQPIFPTDPRSSEKERTGEPGYSEKGPTTYRDQVKYPRPTGGRTQLEPKKTTTGVRGPGGGATRIRQVQAVRSRQDSLWLSFTNYRDNATYPHRQVRGPNELEKCEENCETSHGACERTAADQSLSCLSPRPSPGS